MMQLDMPARVSRCFLVKVGIHCPSNSLHAPLLTKRYISFACLLISDAVLVVNAGCLCIDTASGL